MKVLLILRSASARLAAANVISSGLTFAAMFLTSLWFSRPDFGAFFYGYSMIQLGVALADAPSQTRLMLGMGGMRGVRQWRLAACALAAVVAGVFHGGVAVPLSLSLTVGAAAYLQSEMNYELNRVIGAERFNLWGTSSIAINAVKGIAMCAVIPFGAPALALAAYGVSCRLGVEWLRRSSRSEATEVSTDSSLGSSRWYLTSSILTGVHARLDPPLLSLLGATAASVGDYGRFLLILSGQLLLLSSFVTRLMPVILRQSGSERLRHAIAASAIMLTSGLGIVGFCLLVPSYRGATALYLVVFPAVVLQGLTVPQSLALYHIDRGRITALINAIELIVSVVVSLGLVSASVDLLMAVAVGRSVALIIGSVCCLVVLGVGRRHSADPRPARVLAQLRRPLTPTTRESR